VDHTVAGGRSSPELGLVAALGHSDMLQRHGLQEGSMRTLGAGSPRAEERRGGIAVVGSKARRQRSVREVLGKRR
jgi:hypothetical protein